jgi:hypothetical protein
MIRNKSARLRGYIDAGGTYQDGANPDPTYGGTVPPPSYVPAGNPGDYAPEAGYDRNGNFIGLDINPKTGVATTRKQPNSWTLPAIAAIGLVLLVAISGKRR